MKIFDKNLIKLHKARSAKLTTDHNFLIEHAASLINDRLGDFKGNFDTALDIGGVLGNMGTFLKARNVKKITHTDICPDILNKISGHKIVADPEFLPFAPKSFDLITSTLNLHNINDLPGCLIQIQNCLKPNGVFIANLFGLDTLTQLRQVLTEVEIKHYGGAGLRISPFTDVKTIGSLMQRADFCTPIADSEKIEVHYNNVKSLINDLRQMGETNYLIKKNRPLNRKIFAEVENLYKEKFPNPDGGITVTFELIFITGLAAQDNIK